MTSCFCVCVVWVIIVCRVSANFLLDRPYQVERNQTVLFETWKKLENAAKKGMENTLKTVLPILMRFTSELDLSEECEESLRRFIFGLSRFDQWALQMFDATGKIPSGFMVGTVSSLGNYDECVSIKVPDSAEGLLPELVGRYCVLDFRAFLPPKPSYFTMFETVDGIKDFHADIPPMDLMKRRVQYAYFLSYRFGVCVPSTCGTDDVTKIIGGVYTYTGLTGSITTCETKEEYHLDDLQYTIIILLTLLIVVVIVCTVTDSILDEYSINATTNESISLEEDKYGTWREVCSAFSVNKNITILLTPTAEEGASNLACLHGIKFFSITWVVIGHTYLLFPLQIVESLELVRTEIQKFIFQPVVNALYTVDTFFFIAFMDLLASQYSENEKVKLEDKLILYSEHRQRGFLVAYLSNSFVNRFGKKHFSVAAYIAKRVIRLLPMTLFGMGLAFLIPLLGSGPIWHETIDLTIRKCKSNWWMNLLFIQNFWSMKDMCLPHFWYMAADLQLYITALVFLFLSFWKKMAAVICGVCMIILSAFLNGFIVNWFDVPATVIIANPDPTKIFRVLQLTHILPHSHLSVYAVGLILGMFLAENPSLKISKPVQALMWTVSVLSCACAVYGTIFWNSGRIPQKSETWSYALLTRTTWALGLTWLVFACFSGYGGLVNRILSWNAFVPFSRLSLSTYIVHCMIIWVFLGNQRATIMGHQMQAVWFIIGNIVLSYTVGFLVYVFFEAPLIQLERLAFKRFFLKKQQAKQEKNNGVPMNQPNNQGHQNEDTAVYRL